MKTVENHSYPNDNMFITEWYSDRFEDGDLRGTRDHYITLRLQSNGDWVVHTGYEDSDDYGYCSGDYYGDDFDKAYAGFKERAERKGFSQIIHLKAHRLKWAHNLQFNYNSSKRV